MKNTVCIIAAALALSACASKEQARVEDIAKSPLRDLNISKTEIPLALQEAVGQPYVLPGDQSCPVLAGQVAVLDEALGPDIDVPVAKMELDEKARATLSNAATGALQNTVEGAIPFRGWLRKLSGAERHSRHVEEAILAGKVRRGFLKGLMVSHSCKLDFPTAITAK